MCFTCPRLDNLPLLAGLRAAFRNLILFQGNAQLQQSEGLLRWSALTCRSTHLGGEAPHRVVLLERELGRETTHTALLLCGQRAAGHQQRCAVRAGSAQQSVPPAPTAAGRFHICLRSVTPIKRSRTHSRIFPAAFLCGQTPGNATMFCEHGAAAPAAAEAVGPALPAPRSWGGRCRLLHAQGHASGSRRLPEPGVVLSPSEEIKNTWMLILRHLARGVALCLLVFFFPLQFFLSLTRKKTTFRKLWCSLLPCERLWGR